uniref:C-type lectin domain-containing protein n=1 Tax=Panagrolaimus davidi TaxID=227884 RepID=A0A914QGY8_9BILA
MSYNNFWIGLYTTDNPVQLNTTWQWTDNTAVNYIPWYNVIPSLDKKLCAISGYNYNGFSNADCTASYLAVCKQPPLETIPTSNPVSTTTFKPINPCDISMQTFSNYFIPQVKMNWTTAEEYCELCGGYLTSFHSTDELNTIVNYLNAGNYWTGLYSDNNERTWKWKDGTTYDFSYWYPGNPNQAGASCANLKIIDYNPYGMANTPNCSTSLYGICKYRQTEIMT